MSVGWEGQLLQFLPFHSDISAPIRDLVVAATQDILTVEWYHEYYLCRNFTVIFDDNVVPECTNITALNCTIRNRDIGKVYQVVRVVSTEFYTDLIETSVMTTVFYPNSTGMHNNPCMYVPRFITMVYIDTILNVLILSV